MERQGPRAVVLRLDLDESPFDYVAGQAVWLGRPDRSTRAPYSIACAPARARATRVLEFVIRTGLDGRVGPHLDPLEPGAVLSVEGPAGGFTLPRPVADRALLFVAGGVGIAPLRAMIQEALACARPPELSLLYSARTADDFAFAAEFEAMAAGHRLRFVRTVTGEPGATARPAGRITREMLASLITGPDTRCFVCGPGELVGDVSLLLRAIGIPPDLIVREAWS